MLFDGWELYFVCCFDQGEMILWLVDVWEIFFCLVSRREIFLWLVGRREGRRESWMVVGQGVSDWNLKRGFVVAIIGAAGVVVDVLATVDILFVVVVY